MSDPIRIISRAKNNRLMEFREYLGMSVKEFAEFVGISYASMIDLQALNRYPSDEIIGKFRERCGSAADEMFPEYLKKVSKSVAVRTISESEVLSLSGNSMKSIQAITENSRQGMYEALDLSLATLNVRQRRVIEARFGLKEGDESTLDDLAAELGVSRERVRQIERKALQSLRHPRSSRKLAEHIGLKREN